MFTRIVEMTVRPESRDTIVEIHANQVLPSLRKVPGFIDAISLTGNENPNQFVSITFWKTQQHAETYHQDTYPQLISLVASYVTHPPTIRTYDVLTSTVHKIAAGKAA